MILEGVRIGITLEEVAKTFTFPDDVEKIAFIKNASNSILCQFSCDYTPMLLENEHSTEDGSRWKVVQVSQYQPEPVSGSQPGQELVPLSHALSDITVNFRE